MSTIDLLLPQPARLAMVLAVALVILALIGLGRLVAGRQRPALVLFVGWGAASFVFVVLGTLTPVSFRLLCGALLVPALAGLSLLWRERRDDWAAWQRIGRTVVLAVPLLLIVAGMRISQWDDLDHWAVNGFYLAAHDHFPSLAEPSTVSRWPAYPYALPLISYAAGLLLGRFSDVAGIVVNLTLLIAVAVAIGDMMADCRTAAGNATRRRLLDWGSAAAALAIAIPLNPSFVAKIALTDYSDSATGCAVAVAALLAVRWRDAVRDGATDPKRLAVACGCVLTVLVSVRQANQVLAVLLVIGVGLALLCDRRREGRGDLASGVLALPMPALTLFLWQLYAAAEIPVGALTILPPGEWHLDQLGEILTSMATVMVSKSGHFALVAALLGVAIAATLGRRGRLDGSALVLCRILAVVFVGYTSFLFVAYVVIFNEFEGPHAVSFWRYSTQLGMLAIVTAVAVALPYWRLRSSVAALLSIVAIVLVVAVPSAFVKKIRFDVEHPHDGFLIAAGRQLGQLLPSGATIDFLDPHNSVSDLMLVRYQVLFAPDWSANGVIVTLRPGAVSPKVVSAVRSHYIWLADGGPGVSDSLGQDLPAGAAYLLEREGDRFALRQTWPDTPETETFAKSDFR